MASKENIKYDNDTSWLYDLKPATFNFKNDDKKAWAFGLIAEDVEEVAPWMADYNYNEDGSKELFSVKYQHLAPAMLNELQRHEKSIKMVLTKEEQLEKRVKELEQEVKMLKAA